MRPIPRDMDAIREAAWAAADAARPATLRHFRQPLEVESKAADFDPVTRADREAEAAIRAVLGELRPADGVRGEEAADRPGTSGLTWIVDPIDGTRGFISGTPTWGVLIALADRDGPICGVIDQPFTGERFWGGPGGATWSRDDREHSIRTRGTETLSEATIFTTFPQVGTDAERAGFERVAGRCRLTRFGCDCYAYALLAAGQIDLVVEAGLQAYDIAAPLAVVEAAGGVVTAWDGGPAHEGGTAVAAATPALHAAALERLRG